MNFIKSEKPVRNDYPNAAEVYTVIQPFFCSVLLLVSVNNSLQIADEFGQDGKFDNVEVPKDYIIARLPESASDGWHWLFICQNTSDIQLRNSICRLSVAPTDVMLHLKRLR